MPANGTRIEEQGKWAKGRRLLVPLALLLCPPLSGCAGFWDEVTSRDFHVKEWFIKPSPLVVLRDSNDGDKRAKALRALREPNQHGGTEEDQTMVLTILKTAAVSERQPLCRMAAIQSLGHFEDPRAVEALKEAFYAAGSFPPDTTTMIRCHALTALGNTKSPAAVDLLAKVVREPSTVGTEHEKQQDLDVRIAAARALANFSHYQGTEALVQVLRSEKDVALRDRAHESLQLCTGKKLPPDSSAWEALLHEENHKDVAEQQKRKKVLGWF